MNHLHVSPLLTRRRFTQVFATAVAGLAAGCGSSGKSKAQPLFGIITGIEDAEAVKAAGGDFFASSVAGYLDPDGPEAEFVAKLAALKNAPIPMLGANSFIRRKDLHCTGPDANHGAIMEYAVKAFDRAKRANVKAITFGSGGSRKLPAGFSKAEADQQFIALLKLMGPEAAKRGLIVVVEPLQQKECNYINNIKDVEKVVRGAAHPAILGTADLYHMVIEGDTPADLAKAMDIVAHVEIAEVEGRSLPGKHGQDFRPYFKVMKAAGYTGTIAVEGKWELSELPRGIAEMRKQWAEA